MATLTWVNFLLEAAYYGYQIKCCQYAFKQMSLNCSYVYFLKSIKLYPLYVITNVLKHKSEII